MHTLPPEVERNKRKLLVVDVTTQIPLAASSLSFVLF
jgi:hypothetical protein